MMKTNLSKQGTAYWLSPLPKKAKAQALVLIHGIGLSHTIWQDYLAPLNEHYQVLVYDLLGHGESLAPQSAPKLTSYAKQLVALLDELNIAKAHLVGFSLGGMINRRVAMDYPDRVRSLIILNSPHERTPEAQAIVEKRAKDTHVGGAEHTMPETLVRWFTEDFRQHNPQVVTQVAKAVLANDPMVYSECRQVLATGVLELVRPNPPIKLPTLVITCAHDSGSTPSMSQAISAEIEGSKCVIIPQLQHMGIVQQPQLFVTVIKDFLTNQ